MYPHKQVTSFEQSKKLYGLGVKQESYFAWVCDAPFFDGNDGERDTLMNPEQWDELIENCGDEFQTYSAFTVAELGELLPPYFASHKRDDMGDWLCFDNQYEKITDEDFRGISEVDARAKMLVYLLENKLV